MRWLYLSKVVCRLVSCLACSPCETPPRCAAADARRDQARLALQQLTVTLASPLFTLAGAVAKECMSRPPEVLDSVNDVENDSSTGPPAAHVGSDQLELMRVSIDQDDPVTAALRVTLLPLRKQ